MNPELTLHKKEKLPWCKVELYSHGNRFVILFNNDLINYNYLYLVKA
jgi:hypothetical protein